MTSSTEAFEDEEEKMLSQFRKCVPALTSALHKGQCGRIGVIGGSYEYSGAPYYVAMTSLRLGADLAHVFCTRDVATPIRSYSPDVIVHSTLDGDADSTTRWLPRLHALVVGPGLGREPEIFDTTREIVRQAKLLNKLLVFDADSLHLLASDPELLSGYPNAVLTPNLMELEVLKRAALFQGVHEAATSCNKDATANISSVLRVVSDFFGGCSILLKGPSDALLGGGSGFKVIDRSGGPCRCGGQGDTLAAAVAVFCNWTLQYARENGSDELSHHPLLVGSYAASVLIREASKRTFDKHGRSMVASDMIPVIAQTFRDLFDS